MIIDGIFQQSFWFILACGFLVVLAGEAALKYRRPWAVPAIVGYATIAAWYLMEPIYFPENFVQFKGDILDSACIQIAEFLIFLRIFTVMFVTVSLRNLNAPSPGVSRFPASNFLYINAAIWIALLAIGVYRMNGDLFGALFPIDSRAGVSMWARGAANSAGNSGFLISVASYIYVLACAMFWMLWPFLRKSSAKFLALFLIAVSWPYFLLDGSRNVFLAVFLPGFASYVLFSRHKLWVKVIIALALFEAINVWFLLVLDYRNVGFEAMLSGKANNIVLNAKHTGLNMMSELCYANAFYNSGLLHLDYGTRYLAELANVIPRALWPDKPLLGIDYAILRGFGGAQSDIGVIATISTGVIGQGFLNFGPFFGPAAAGILFAAWIAILTRFRCQQGSVPRLTLFLLGLGLTFNLGRDITLLVLWPFVFAYIIVRIFEKWQGIAPTSRRSVRPVGAL